jgi:hypothetical protein
VLRPYEFVANGETCVRANLNPHPFRTEKGAAPNCRLPFLVLILGTE